MLVGWVSYNIYHVAWIDVSISVPKPAKTVLKLCFPLYFLSKQPLYLIFTVVLICKGKHSFRTVFAGFGTEILISILATGYML